jgi:uncharacterized protein (TIGR02270 family)
VTDKASIERSAASARARAHGATATGHAGYVSEIGLKRALAVAEEAAFLWVSRRAVVQSSAVTFDVLARMDQRLSRLVYKLSERPFLARRFLQHNPTAFKSGLTFVTALVALRGGAVDVFEELLTRLEPEPELFSPLASALSWLEYGEVRAHIERLLTASPPGLVRLGLVAAVAHRVDPGGALGRASSTDLPALRASALEAIGRLAVKDLRPRLHAALADQDGSCRFWAAWSSVRLGDRDGIPVLGRFAADGGRFARPACEIALRALDTDQAVHAQRRLQSVPGNERLAIAAAGIVGDPTLVTQLFEAMKSPLLARSAGAAFCRMTGCDLRRDDLDAERPPDPVALDAAAAGASGDGTTAAESPDADRDEFSDETEDELAWPDTARLRRWWDEKRPAFVPGTRYVAGLAVRPAEMAQVLRTGNQQQRAAAALELALLHPGAPLLDVTAPAHRQMRTSERPLEG